MIYFDSTSIVSIPCFYLYFEDLAYENKKKAKKLIHFVMPVILILLIILSKGTPGLYGKVIIIMGAIFMICYAIAGINFLQKNIWNRKSEIVLIQKQNDLIKKWTIFCITIFIALFLVRFLTMTLLKMKIEYNYEFSWLTAILWCCIFIKIILTPELTYGYSFFKEKIELITKQISLPELWNLNSPMETITVEKDNILSKRVGPKLDEYIHKIEEASFHSKEFRKPDLSIEDLSSYLGIPSSHLSFVFKYHCKESFVDFKKFIRVHDAIKLLENGYLKSNTIESLSAEVGFLSYNTFHYAFKSITGVTTKEYLKRL
jgi:AraC-like DNA-binding protein